METELDLAILELSRSLAKRLENAPEVVVSESSSPGLGGFLPCGPGISSLSRCDVPGGG